MSLATLGFSAIHTIISSAVVGFQRIGLWVHSLFFHVPYYEGFTLALIVTRGYPHLY
jgi:hypothetical protein